MPDKRSKSELDERDYSVVTSADLKAILDVNEKAIEIYLEVEKQNEQILSELEYFRGMAEKTHSDLEGLKRKESDIEELLDDDNASDHKTTHDEIKELKGELKEIRETIIDISNINTRMFDLFDDLNEEVKDKIKNIDKSLFRLIIILGSAGVAAVIAVLQNLLK